MSLTPLRVGLIGDGGISRSVRSTLARVPEAPIEIRAVLARRSGAGPVPTVTSLDAFLEEELDVVVECASHEAVAKYGATVLRAGVPLMVVSIGSLCDTQLYEALQEAAVVGRSRLILAAGAIGGIDALGAARLGRLTRVHYRGRKPPLAWRGTPAEQLLDLAAVSEPQTFYRGNAREAARLYPRNANVAATIALAGLGFDRTEVELVADPATQHNVHELSFDSADGQFNAEIRGVPSTENPKTSMLTARSIARVLINLRTMVVM